jgi:RNA polymerase sigma-70 factor (ECF subfamily)
LSPSAQHGEIYADTLVRDYYSYLERICLSILGNEQESQDVVQETLLRALLHQDKFEVGTSLKNWLTTIAVNLSRDLLRRRAARYRLQGILHLVGSASDVRVDPEEVMISSEQERRLRLAVKALGEKHRLPIILRYIHGLPVSQIAQILNLSEGTVHSRLHYALRKLQASMPADELATSHNDAGGSR